MNIRDLFPVAGAEAERHFDRLRRDLDRAFESVQGAATRFADERAAAPVDIAETETEVIAMIDLPGVAEEDVDLRVAENMLELRALRKPVEIDGAALRHQERASGEMTRSVSMPAGLDGDAAEATLKQGVLTVRIPRKVAAQGRKINVAAG